MLDSFKTFLLILFVQDFDGTRSGIICFLCLVEANSQVLDKKVY